MKFKKYSSIENSYRMKFLDYLANYDLLKGTWVVQEKIHGTNFQIAYDGKEFKVGKRSSWISELSHFFKNCWIPIFEDLAPRIKRLFDELNSHTTINELVFHGELFGGVYNHPKVEKVQNAVRVQKEISYAPGNHFFCFDIKQDGEFLPVSSVEFLCHSSQVPYVKTLFRGTFKECLVYSNKFQTTIPRELGLPEIENNICEGIVIRPSEPKYLPSGQRAILKSKNEKFSDKSGTPKMPKKVVPLNPKAQAFYDELITLITVARLDSVMLKEGDFTKKDFGKVLNLIWLDVLEEFQKDNGDAFNNLEKALRTRVTKNIKKYIADTLRVEFFKRV